jgi:hypothetical protein
LRRTSLALVAVAALLPALPAGAANRHDAPVYGGARAAAPVVFTGVQIPSWSRLSAQGVAKPYPAGATTTGDGVRHAHNGTLVVPPDARTGVDPDRIVAYKWNGLKFQEVPVQVDQRFPYFLANGRSDFSVYSGTDEELTYAWAPDDHATGEEAWKKVFGDCTARYATEAENASLPAARRRRRDRLHGAMRRRTTQAPLDARSAPRSARATGQVLRSPTRSTGAAGFVYLFVKAGGSSFTAANGYVR